MRCTLFILGLALLCLSSCGPTKKGGASSLNPDSWYHPPGDFMRFRQVKPLPDSDVTEVAPGFLSSAEVQLRDVAWVKIAPERASELVGRPMVSKAGGSFFLVRAACLNRGTGRFSATLKGSELLVEHGSLGHSAVPMKHQPLVVCLPQPPETVFVSCKMAE